MSEYTIVPEYQPIKINRAGWKRLKKQLGLNKKNIPRMGDRISAACSLASELGIEIESVEIPMRALIEAWEIYI